MRQIIKNRVLREHSYRLDVQARNIIHNLLSNFVIVLIQQSTCPTVEPPPPPIYLVQERFRVIENIVMIHEIKTRKKKYQWYCIQKRKQMKYTRASIDLRIIRSINMNQL